MTILETAHSCRRLAERNGWDDYLTPENIAVALSVEAAELLDLFKWGNAPTEDELRDELADVGIFLIQLADRAGIDLGDAINFKLNRNWERPVEGPRFSKGE